VNDQRFAPGSLFHGRYRVVQAIKAGGMGAVYEVIDETINARRALKTMLPSIVSAPELRARFALEARVTGSIESNHLVRVSDAGVDEATGVPFLIMDLLRGEDLGSVVKRRGALPPAEVATYLHQVALALDKTHAASIVHRDLKPDNLFVTTRDDGSPCVKILDFGIAKVVAQHAQTQHTTQAVGTPLYMAPEQIRGSKDIGPRADVYAFGHIAYTLLTGEPFWTEEKERSASTFTLFAEIVAGAKEAPVARAQRRRHVWLPPGFDAWFARVTATKPEDREGRAMDAAALLAAALGTPPPRAPSPSLPQREASRALVAALLDAPQGAGLATYNTGGTGKAVTADPTAAPGASRRSPLVLAGLVVGAVIALLLLVVLLRPPTASTARESPTAVAAAIDTVLPAVPTADPGAVPATADGGAAPAASGRAAPTAASPKPSKGPCRIVPIFDADGNKHFKQECP
jgi:tRNA A-37 threonylcarbamoyl transferase component Bud32